MKKILLIATGGTIACTNTEKGLMPSLSSDELLGNLETLRKDVIVDTYQLFNIDSTNIEPSHWLEIVKVVEDNYNDYDGFVITHGTDTLAYTGAALNYLIQDSRKPIVLTGSQKPISLKDSDARSNLSNAINYAACDKAHGVSVVFDNKAILGARARKQRSRSFDAFASVNYPEIAWFNNGTPEIFIEVDYKNKPTFYHELNTNLFLLKCFPGVEGNIFHMLKDFFDIFVIEGYGTGGIPSYDKDAFTRSIKKLKEAGKTVVVTTQVAFEGSNLNVYEVGKKYKDEFDILEAYDMTVEALVTKLMWIRALTDDEAEVRRLLYTEVNKDIKINR